MVSAGPDTNPKHIIFGFAAIALGIVLGVAVALAWPKTSVHVSTPSQANATPSQAILAAAYLQVRDANMGPLLQAINGIGGDCATGDPGRCSLSLAYTLALVQKFEDEMRAISVPVCLAASDAELKLGLRLLDNSLHQALNATFPNLLGVDDLKASQALLEQAACPTS